MEECHEPSGNFILSGEWSAWKSVAFAAVVIVAVVMSGIVELYISLVIIVVIIIIIIKYYYIECSGCQKSVWRWAGNNAAQVWQGHAEFCREVHE